MSKKVDLKFIIEKAKQNKFVLLISVVYSFIWAIYKIIFGVLSFSYFFCISGISTLLFGFIKRIYLKNYSINNLQKKVAKSIVISLLIIVSSALFTFYMARLFFISDTKQYGLIMSITIATFSFAELGLSIYNFIKAKRTKDILLQSFKGCSLVTSCFAIVITQVALLSATSTPADFYNGLTGTILGLFAIIIGIYLLIKSSKEMKNIN